MGRDIYEMQSHKKARLSLKSREEKIKKSEERAKDRRDIEARNRTRQKAEIIRPIKSGKIKLRQGSPTPTNQSFIYKIKNEKEVYLDAHTTPKEPNKEYRLESDPNWL